MDLYPHLRTALRETMARYHAVYHHESVGMIVMDAGSRLVEVNPALCRLLDRDRGELIGGTLDELVHPDSRQSIHDLLKELLEGSMPVLVRECRFACKDGRTLAAKLTVASVVGDQDRPVLVVCILVVNHSPAIAL